MSCRSRENLYKNADSATVSVKIIIILPTVNVHLINSSIKLLFLLIKLIEKDSFAIQLEDISVLHATQKITKNLPCYQSRRFLDVCQKLNWGNEVTRIFWFF